MTMFEFPILLLVRAAAVLAAALLAVRLLRRAAASLRYLVLATALTAVLVLPVIEALVPTWHTGALASGPAAAFESPAMPIAETGPAGIAAHHLATVAAPPARASSAPFPWGTLLAGIWLAGMAVLLARVAAGSFGARRIARRAVPAPASA
ncbi:MAG: hypothetical protein JNL83_28065, partial [Myxococcales bacterium]|nr:hypothetical protein [Myxococcales bacterium]